jgi:hypothetical protein
MSADNEMAAFEHLLDVFGGEPERWPAVQLAMAEKLLRRQDAHGEAARRALKEARALDRVINTSMPVSAARMSLLAARIAAAARPNPEFSNIVSMTAARRKPVAAPPRRAVSRDGWATAALLAASLFMGVMAGPASTVLP